MNRLALCLVGMSALVWQSQAHAVSGVMRCGIHLIQDGARSGTGKYEVLKKCGSPTARHGNVWIYERGGVKKIVRFDDSGRLSRIIDG
jgi:hypothetical protein